MISWLRRSCLLAAAVSAGCAVSFGPGRDAGPKPALGAGAPCQRNTDCTSGLCETTCNGGPCPDGGWCAGGICSCGGAQCDGGPSTDCAAGWACVYFPPSNDPLSILFGNTGGGNACVATCTACPPNQSCSGGGNLCQASTPPPTVAIDDGLDGGIALVVREGTPVHFHGIGASPHEPIASYQWDFGDGTQDAGIDVDHEFTAGTFSQRFVVTLVVTDSFNAQASTTTLVQPCKPSGSVVVDCNVCCGDAGVGCWVTPTPDGGQQNVCA